MDASLFTTLAYAAAAVLLGGLWLMSYLRARAVARQLEQSKDA